MKKLYVLAGAAALGFAGSAQALVVTQSTDATALVAAILGSGVTVMGTPILHGYAGQAGTFSQGFGGISNGVVLSTGDVNQIPGSNASQVPETLGTNSVDYATESNLNTVHDGGFDLAQASTSGDAGLDAIIGETWDAAALEFDFQLNGGLGGSVFVNYIFASEEYIDFVDSEFNDIFAFFLDGVNIALVPNTASPVAINTVNPNLNGQYFKNNVANVDNLYPVAGTAIKFDGYTVGLTASAVLTPGTHTIKFVVGDVFDSKIDSGIFLQGGSFANQETTIPEPTTFAMLGLGLAGLYRVRNMKAKAA